MIPITPLPNISTDEEFQRHFIQVVKKWEGRAAEISEWCLPCEVGASFALLEALAEKMWELYEVSEELTYDGIVGLVKAQRGFK